MHARAMHCRAALGMRSIAKLALCACVAWADSAVAQNRQPLAPAAWPLEAIELADGRRLEGLVLAPVNVSGTPAHDASDIEFLQIVRRPGRPMHLVAWPAFPASGIRFVERLAPAEQDTLRERVEAFRAERRRQDEATSIRLARQGDEGPWMFEDPAFTLVSSADPMLTREAIVRLQLTFHALESLVPPVGSAEPVSVQLCGSLAEYRAAQEALGLRLENPAFYVSQRRLLVAGSELPTLLQEWRAVDDQLDAARQRYLEHGNLLDKRLRGLAAELEASGMPRDERVEIVRRARIRGTREQAEEVARIEAARRANAAVVDAARRRFHERLAHEAWHAYADGRLRSGEARGLPAWLDEGLAQVIETAPLEAGELRLDAPDPERLARLREAIVAGKLPPVADIVSADQDAFVGGHGGNEAVAYLAAWGLAFELAVLRPMLTADKVVALCATSDSDPLAAFEGLVGMPIDHFDRQWRQRILALRGRSVSPAP
jgi:hypothetical protein